MSGHIAHPDGWGDIWFCPNCDEEMMVREGQDRVTCPNDYECGKTWEINYDYSFEEGSWRNCSTIREIKP